MYVSRSWHAVAGLLVISFIKKGLKSTKYYREKETTAEKEKKR